MLPLVGWPQVTTGAWCLRPALSTLLFSVDYFSPVLGAALRAGRGWEPAGWQDCGARVRKPGLAFTWPPARSVSLGLAHPYLGLSSSLVMGAAVSGSTDRVHVGPGRGRKGCSGPVGHQGRCHGGSCSAAPATACRAQPASWCQCCHFWNFKRCQTFGYLCEISFYCLFVVFNHNLNL